MDAPRHELRLLAPAQRELEEIALIHMELAGPDSARKITDCIHRALVLLQAHPDMGVRCREKPLRVQGYHMLICGRYLCIYRLLGDTIFVYHVADGRSDYPKLMRDLPRDEEST